MGAGAATLAVGVLGPLIATRAAERVDLGPYRQRAVLALLAIHANTVVSADRLIDQLWAGEPPPSALGTLQAYVSNLRRALEPARPARVPATVIVTEPPGYALRVDPSQLDVLRFEEAVRAARTGGDDPAEALARLEAALALWRGPALVDFEHEDFTGPWRSRLEELRAAAVELRIALLLDLGRAADAVAELGPAIEQWPLRERLRAQLVVALARDGRQGEALRTYDAARRYLRDELGLSPGPELEDAHRRVLAGAEPAGRQPAAPAEPSPPAVPVDSRPAPTIGVTPRSAPSATRLGVEHEAGNLPLPVTTFVGRHRELAQLAGELAHHRVLTLVGPGGVGKTRLALEAAREAADRFADGVWLCELAPVSGGDDVAYALGGVFGVRPQEGLTMADAVIQSLQGRRVLVVVDNCEHVLDAAAELVARIVSRCPTVTVLATSREPLAVQGERVCPLGGLDVVVDAPALFRARAAAADDGLAAAGAESTSVAAICARLDGMPLAIELAAARTRSMTVGDIAARLDDRFRLLRGPARDRPERHQTLLAAIDWSYQLLAAPERALFDRLSIFPGPFDASAASAVCAAAGPGPAGYPPAELDPADVDDLLHQLVDKSVVVTDRSGATTRFLLLETLRQYGASHLDEAERRQLEQRFVGHYLAVAADARARFVSSAAAQGRATFRREWHNLRAALQYALAARDTAAVMGLLDAVHWHAEAAGLVEVGAWAESALDQLGSHPALFGSAGFFATMRGDNEQARRFAEAGVSAASSDDPDTRHCWQTLQLVHWYGGRPAESLDAQLRVAALTDARRDPYAAVFAYASAGGIAAVAGSSEGPGLLGEAARIAEPLANPTVDMWVTVMTAVHDFAEGRLADAFGGFRRGAAQAAACEVPVWETRALAMMARAAARLGHRDAIPICRNLLARLHATRSWSDTYGLLQTVLEAWAYTGRLADAGVVLGFLDAHDLHHTLAAAGRARAAALVGVDPDAVRSLAVGAAMDRDELVAWVLDRLAAASG